MTGSQTTLECGISDKSSKCFGGCKDYNNLTWACRASIYVASTSLLHCFSSSKNTWVRSEIPPGLVQLSPNAHQPCNGWRTTAGCSVCNSVLILERTQVWLQCVQLSPNPWETTGWLQCVQLSPNPRKTTGTAGSFQGYIALLWFSCANMAGVQCKLGAAVWVWTSSQLLEHQVSFAKHIHTIWTSGTWPNPQDLPIRHTSEPAVSESVCARQKHLRQWSHVPLQRPKLI